MAAIQQLPKGAENHGFTAEKPNGPVWTKVTLTQYSNDAAEMISTKCFRDDMPNKRRKKNEDDEQATDSKEEIRLSLDDVLDPELEQENKDRSLRRARSTIRKKIIEGELDHMMTLTYRENMCDEQQGWKDFVKFIRKLKTFYPDLKYVVVIEKQKRGAVHFHAAVHGFLYAKTVRSCWLDVVGQGNVDLQAKRHNQTLFGMAKYLAKYLQKAQETVERFGKMFRSSHNIKLYELTFYLPAALHGDLMIQRLFTMLHQRIEQRWSSENCGHFKTTWLANYI